MNEYVKRIVRHEMYSLLGPLNREVLADQAAMNELVLESMEQGDLENELARYLEVNNFYDYYHSAFDVTQQYLRKALDTFKHKMRFGISHGPDITLTITVHSEVGDLDAIETHLENDANVAEYVRMTEEEYERYEGDPYHLIVESMEDYFSEHRTTMYEQIQDFYRWAIETDYMGTDPYIVDAPMDDIINLFDELDEQYGVYDEFDYDDRY